MLIRTGRWRKRGVIVFVFLALICGVSLPVAAQEQSVLDTNLRAYEAFQYRDYVQARQLAEQAWRLSEKAADRRGAGFAAANIAAVLTIAGHFDEAGDWYKKAGARFSQDEHPSTFGRLAAAQALNHLLRDEKDPAEKENASANALLGAGDWRLRYAATAFDLWRIFDVFTANDSLNQLLEEARASGDASRVAAVLQVLGWAATSAGWFNDAIGHYEEEIEVCTRQGHLEQAALARRNIGAVYLRTNDPLQATTSLSATLLEARRLGIRPLEFIILNDLSIAYAQTGDQQRARAVDIEAADVLAAMAADLQHGLVADVLSFDYYHLLRMRVLNQPTFLIDPVPFLLDQLALEPTKDKP